jgi:hypothetical protein
LRLFGPTTRSGARDHRPRCDSRSALAGVVGLCSSLGNRGTVIRCSRVTVTHIFFRRELKPTRRVPAIQLRAETPKNRAQRSGRYPNHRSFGLGATSVSQTRRAGGPICTCPEGKLLDPVRSSSAADRRIIHALEPQRDEDPLDADERRSDPSPSRFVRPQFNRIDGQGGMRVRTSPTHLGRDPSRFPGLLCRSPVLR